jgi:hypothetical protein
MCIWQPFVSMKKRTLGQPLSYYAVIQEAPAKRSPTNEQYGEKVFDL